jgi:diguanylate cyclase (GGDEF)-like protein/PAS domain S-box-containing protein
VTAHAVWRLGIALLLLAGPAHATQGLTFGVLAEHPGEVVEARYRPLMEYLSAQLHGTPVRLEVLDHEQLTDAVAHNRLDLVLTNPGSFLLLRSQHSLGGALATVVRQAADQSTTQMAGVIVTQAARTDITRLTDLRGRRIAVPIRQSLGGFQAPAFELLQAGIRLPAATNRPSAVGRQAPSGARIQLLEVGTHDAVIRAVLDGRAEVGFVRSGVIESLSRDGVLDPSRLRVLNRQVLRGFPFAASTRPYPEWPVVALPRLDATHARRISAALLGLEADHPAALAAGIAGFALPVDYLSVENLARSLRIPPYDVAPSLTWRDFWSQHRIMLSIIGVAAMAIAALLALLATRNRRLAAGEAALQQALARQRALLSATPYPIFEVDADGLVLGSWAPTVRTTTIAPEQLVGKRVAEALPKAAAQVVMQALREAGQHGQAQGTEFSLPTAAGDRWFTLSAGLIGTGANPQRFAVLVRHITAERESRRWLDIAASVFTHAGEGVLISGPDSRILAANRAFLRIMGYPDDEDLIGRYTHELRLDYLGGESFDTLRQSLMQHGTWQGELRGQRESGELYSATLNVNVARDEAGKVTLNFAILTYITPLKTPLGQLQHIAYHDALTGLPNRVLLADRLQQAMARAGRREERVAVVYLDLDGFKAVNDDQGHDQGDALLIAIAQRMAGVLRQTDTLARIGGDEFVAVLTDLATDHEAQPSLQRLLLAANQPVPLAAGEVRVSASLGVAFYPQAEAVDADQLLRQADHALYQAKLAGKNRHHVYDPGRDLAVRNRHEAVQEIRAGLQGGQFVLHYQPKVNMRTGQVIGAEALIRWQHPQRGLLAPGLFLPVIENHSLAVELGEWVIDSALRQMGLWRQIGLQLPVSVNVGADHLQQPAFAARLRALLQAHPTVERGALEIEILESSALADLEHIARLMRECAEIGVSFALDDFGTGYSSLLYLKHLPAGTLKIDHSFVRHVLDDADNLAILEGILTLARGFGRTPVAEGVETIAQGTLLLQLGCQFGQGFGIARPMPAADLPDWIAGWRAPDAWQGTSRVARDRLPLLMGDLEHRTWIQAIEAWLHGTRAAPPTVSAQAGRFGTWLSSEGRALYGRAPAFGAILDLHQQMHDLADELEQLHAQGRAQEAVARIPDLHALHQRMCGQFGGLILNLNDGDAGIRTRP